MTTLTAYPIECVFRDIPAISGKSCCRTVGQEIDLFTVSEEDLNRRIAEPARIVMMAFSEQAQRDGWKVINGHWVCPRCQKSMQRLAKVTKGGRR